ncbi:dienelactone hydrolase family protein [Micromonospora sp. NPDC050397]|uniref:dienelactone hydrolase family protein n=1 Tax=Micromonospora sp. NPDC050397 TaxID=3364279 RepID=UPI0038500B77
MAEVLLFHHAQGLTSGVRAFAGQLERAGHTVHLPDLYDGEVFDNVDDGMGYAQKLGFPHAILERGRAAAEGLPAGLVYAGFSLGVLPAQLLAQTRPGAKGALFYYSTVPAEEFGSWPAGVPAQIHAMDADAFFVDEGDIDAARALVASNPETELFLYPGDRHLFADGSLPDYDERAATQLTERTLAFLEKIG